jgi:hypothetical protein
MSDGIPRTKHSPRLQRDKNTRIQTQRGLFADADLMKAEIRRALSQHIYKVEDFYHNEGLAQRISRSPLFEKLTLAVIALNSIWISFELDWNTSPDIVDFHWCFLAVDACFCVLGPRFGGTRAACQNEGGLQ